jgi:hypothetical protein
MFLSIAVLVTGADLAAQTSQSSTAASGQASGSANSQGAQVSSQSSVDSSSSLGLSAGSSIQAELTKGIDSKKAKEGDEVVARVTSDVRSGGRVVLAKGSKLFGHVTQARARAKGDAESTMAIAFDRATLKGGQQASLHAVLRALAAPVAATAGATEAEMMEAGPTTAPAEGPARPMSTGPVGGVTSTVGAAAGATVNTAGQTAGELAGGTIGSATSATAGAAPSSSGVINLPGITLNAQANSSLIASTGKSVKLDSGARLLLTVSTE